MKNKYIIYNCFKNMKHLGINLEKKKVKNLYPENCKTLPIDIRELSKWEDVSCSWVGRLNIVMMSVLKLIYRFNAVSIRL